MNPFYENLFEDDCVEALLARQDYEGLFASGAKLRYPKSFLSIYRVVPRNTSKYRLRKLATETLVGFAMTTMESVRKSLNVTTATAQQVEEYFLDNDVVTLAVGNTDVSKLGSYKKRSRAKNPVVYRKSSAPVLLVFRSKNKMDVMIEDREETTGTYARHEAGAVVNTYLQTNFIDVYDPADQLTLDAVYGVPGSDLSLVKMEGKALEKYQVTGIQESITLSEFKELFSSAKKNIGVSNFIQLNNE
ncbi:DNA-binding virion core protein [Nile crocodilepox virus]|uniref:Core protein VP8 n=1 Tax=Nile crocodilepox virus (isolate Crocodylus niloticus/Zimbabwe/Ume/2001) TaxID=1289473 RepID=Q070F8_CPRVZ|nr:DNA-binding virion core protein [Nile crocodilepox virus]ABJ08984.1 DNA-binding virion core protein [Nile crocodilepox virus]